MSQVLAKLIVAPLYGQVVIAVEGASDLPAPETGQERVVATTQSLLIASRGDQDGDAADSVIEHQQQLLTRQPVSPQRHPRFQPGGICAAGTRRSAAGWPARRPGQPGPARACAVQREEDLPPGTASEPVRGVHRQRRLADPGHPADRVNVHHPARAPGTRHRAGQLSQLGSRPVNEAISRGKVRVAAATPAAAAQAAASGQPRTGPAPPRPGPARRPAAALSPWAAELGDRVPAGGVLAVRAVRLLSGCLGGRGRRPGHYLGPREPAHRACVLLRRTL
jgi:hypothetical protein